MDLKSFDNKCVRIVTTFGEIYEGTVSFEDREYAFHEYGHDQEAGRWLRPGRKGEAEKDGETDSSQAQNDGRIFHVDIGAE